MWRELRIGGWALGIAVLSAALHGATEFVLVDEAGGRAFGPYEFVDGAPLLGGKWRVDPQTGGAARFRPAEGPGPASPSCVLTNGARVRIGRVDYHVRLVTAALRQGLEEGRACAAVRDAVAAADAALGVATNDPIEVKAALERVVEANPSGKALAALDEVRTRLDKRIAEEQANRARGLEKVGGRWLAPADAERERKRLEDEANRARGLVEFDGRWMTPNEAADARLKKEADQRKAAEAARAKAAQLRCARCAGTGWIYYELHPSPTLSDGKSSAAPPLRVEKPGKPGSNTRYPTQQARCPDCNGTGQRQSQP